MGARLVLVRIDDRLIHGQVAVGWAKLVQPEVIVVADDQVVNDPLQKTLMEMAATQYFSVQICGVDEVAGVCNSAALAGKRTLLLFSTPRDVLRAIQTGLAIAELNVGGMRFKPGKKQILKAIAIDEQDIIDFKRLIELKIKTTIQMVPTDDPVNVQKFC